jgi:hypothetical protein
MAPKRAASKEPDKAPKEPLRPGWPKGTDRAAAAANRAKAVRLKQPSYAVPYKTEGGKMNEKVMWIANGTMPAIMARGVNEIDGARVTQRPSKKAYSEGFQDVRDVPELQPGGFDGNTTGWATAEPSESRR